jgi:uncharacterized membrane protein YfcA
MDFGLLIVLLGIMAFLYASVGHGGASGYLAVLAIFSVAPALMKQTALLLNLGVSLMSFIAFYQQGFFKWRLFWPFALVSIPAAFWGARIPLSDSNYKQILGACLFIAVLRMLTSLRESPTKQLPLWAGLTAGSFIGLLSGMIGIGGGIILSPILLLFRWANLKEAAAVSALFVLPTYPTLLAAIEMDETGSTRIGKYVFNHSFLIPGVVAIALSVLFGFMLANMLLS